MREEGGFKPLLHLGDTARKRIRSEENFVLNPFEQSCGAQGCNRQKIGTPAPAALRLAADSGRPSGQIVGFEYAFERGDAVLEGKLAFFHSPDE